MCMEDIGRCRNKPLIQDQCINLQGLFFYMKENISWGIDSRRPAKVASQSTLRILCRTVMCGTITRCTIRIAAPLRVHTFHSTLYKTKTGYYGGRADTCKHPIVGTAFEQLLQRGPSLVKYLQILDLPNACMIPNTPYTSSTPYTPYTSSTPYNPYNLSAPYTPYTSSTPYNPYTSSTPYTPLICTFSHF